MTTESSHQRGQLAASIIANIVLPIATFYGLQATGVGDVAALLISGLWPLLGIGLTIRRTRRVDELSVFVLIGLMIGVVTAAVSDNARGVFYKDSLTTGLTGVVFLVTLAGPRPLTCYFGRRFAAGDTKEGRAWWDGLWQYAGFRRLQRLLTLMWGTALVVEAVARAVLTRELGINDMVVVNNVGPYVVVAALIGVSVALGRRRAAAAQAEATDAVDGDGDVEKPRLGR